MALVTQASKLTITDYDGKVVYDGPADLRLTPVNPSLDIARDGSSWTYHLPWSRAFTYKDSVA